MTRIISAANARFKALVKLAHSSRERRERGLSLLDGVHLVAAYVAHVGPPEQLVVSAKGLDNPEIRGLLDKLTSSEPLVLSDVLFKQLSTVDTPTGIIATVNTPRPPLPPADIGACVMLDGIQDPGNLGSILRSAAAAGFRRVLLSKSSVQAWSPRVLRAGMGAHFMLQVHEQCDLLKLAHAYKGRVIATSRRAEKSVFTADLRGEIALLFGNEGAGLAPELADAAGEWVTIPMPGQVESLNVAAAAAVCLFERVRQLQAYSHPRSA